jgi:hypothetical protein
MNNFKQRIDKLEKSTGKGYSHVRLVFSDEEALAVYAELGDDVHIIHIVPLSFGRRTCPV